MCQSSACQLANDYNSRLKWVTLLYNLSESIEIDEGFFERLSEEVGSEGNSTNDSEKKEKRGRRSHKKKFTKSPDTQNGGNKSALDINVHMLRDFYSKNYQI